MQDQWWQTLPYILFIYLFISFIFINWRLITSQHCSGFCHTLTWISHGVTCTPHPDPPPTSLSTRVLWVFPVHQTQALVSCIPPGLVICFTIDNICVVLSKHPTLGFSHRVQNSVLYICVSSCFAYILLFDLPQSLAMNYHSCLQTKKCTLCLYNSCQYENPETVLCMALN